MKQFLILWICSLAIARDLAEIAARVNALKTSWQAQPASYFQNTSLSHYKKLCGSILKGEPGYYALPTRPPMPVSTLPKDFDAREQWPQCANVIGLIRDQSECGSCWAFGSTEAYNDRLCIKSGTKILLSPEDTMACCKNCGMGCSGGNPTSAWKWFTTAGVSSGGDYASKGSGATCKPYSLPPCAHCGLPSPPYPPCPHDEYPTPQCVDDCTDSNYTISYTADKKVASSAYNIKGETQMQTEIMTYGSITATFIVYDDFPTYKSGVYHHMWSARKLGGHAIKIIGWGVDTGSCGIFCNYWLVANSWNSGWGNKGYFKISRGVDESGIEDDVSAGLA